MNLLLILLFSFGNPIYSLIINNNYRTSYYVHINVNSKEKIDKFFSDYFFYDKYFEKVGAENIVFEKLNDENNMSFSYDAKPNIPYLPSNIPKINIHQYWYKDEQYYYGEIRTKYIDFNIIVEAMYLLETNNHCLYFEAELIKKKKKYLPNICLDILLKDFCDILQNISCVYF